MFVRNHITSYLRFYCIYQQQNFEPSLKVNWQTTSLCTTWSPNSVLLWGNLTLMYLIGVKRKTYWCASLSRKICHFLLYILFLFLSNQMTTSTILPKCMHVLEVQSHLTGKSLISILKNHLLQTFVLWGFNFSFCIFLITISIPDSFKTTDFISSVAANG